jgi:hypothetical protein
MARATREVWRTRVESWRASGLTAKQFAAEHGIRAGTLVWWSWRLGMKAKQPLAARTKSPPAKIATTPPLTFLEMTAVYAEPIEVVLPSGLRVRVGDGFAERTLARVLDVLERR